MGENWLPRRAWRLFHRRPIQPAATTRVDTTSLDRSKPGAFEGSWGSFCSGGWWIGVYAWWRAQNVHRCLPTLAKAPQPSRLLAWQPLTLGCLLQLLELFSLRGQLLLLLLVELVHHSQPLLQVALVLLGSLDLAVEVGVQAAQDEL